MLEALFKLLPEVEGMHTIIFALNTHICSISIKRVDYVSRNPDPAI